MTIMPARTTGRFTAVSSRTGKELSLAMQRLWLGGHVTPFGARLLVEHTFESSERRPIEAVYAFALPRDGALRSFRVKGKGFEVTSDLRPTEEAIREYERGIDGGSLSLLARQYGDGLINLTVGNLLPHEPVQVVLEILAGVELHDDGFRFRFPFTLAPSYHREARASRQADSAEMELPPEEFGDLLLPVWKGDGEGLHTVGFDLDVIAGQAIERISSPSHNLSVSGQDASRLVNLAVEGDVPDRDLVLEATMTEPWQVAWSSQGALTSLIASSCFGKPDDEAPKRIVFVLDRSGSMHGSPFHQAQQATEAGIAALRPEDSFSVVAFDNAPEAMSQDLRIASQAHRDTAREFLEGIRTGGGTDLAAGVRAAASLLGEQGGDLLLLTDGQVFGTEGILDTARSTGARIHVLGIGSASQDRFLAQLADQTEGQCRFLTPKERVDIALLELFAGVAAPVASDVRLEAGGEGFPGRDVLPGRPLLIQQDATGETLDASWSDGDLEIPVGRSPAALEGTLRLIAGASKIAEAESRLSERELRGGSNRLTELSSEYGLASRSMALVAVVRREDDRAGRPPMTRVVPVGLPQGQTFETVFGSGRHAILADASIGLASPAPPESDFFLRKSVAAQVERKALAALEGRRARREGSLTRFLEEGARPQASVPAGQEAGDLLVRDAGQLAEDGGMPGTSAEERVEASLSLLERLLDAGSTLRRGPFRHHVRRLLTFLESSTLEADEQRQLEELRRRAIGRRSAWKEFKD